MVPVFAVLTALIAAGFFAYRSRKRYLHIIRHAEEHGYKNDLVNLLRPLIQSRIGKFGE